MIPSTKNGAPRARPESAALLVIVLLLALAPLASAEDAWPAAPAPTHGGPPGDVDHRFAAGLYRSLVHALGDRLSGCGFRPEKRDYRPHVTLARKVQPIPACKLERPVFWQVAEFALVVARPGQRPRYRVERSWILQGA